MNNGDLLVAGSTFDKNFDPFATDWVREVDHDGIKAVWESDLGQPGTMFSANTDGGFALVVSSGSQVLTSAANPGGTSSSSTTAIPSSPERTTDLAVAG